MADEEQKVGVWPIVDVGGFGTTKDDELGFLSVTVAGYGEAKLAFDEHIANPLAGGIMAAASHLLSKLSMREDPDSTLIPGTPISITGARVRVADHGPNRVILLELRTADQSSLLFALDPRGAETLAKRLQKRNIRTRSGPQGRA